MNLTAVPGTGLGRTESHAQALLSCPPALGALLASQLSGELVGGGVDASAFAPPPPVFPAHSSLMYDNKSITSESASTYELISEANGSKGVQGFPDRLKRFGTRHSRAVEMSAFLRQLPGDRIAKRRAARLEQCGKFLTFRHYWTIDELRLHSAHFCQQSKLCPLCAVRRGAKLLRRHTERVLLVLADRPELRMHLVTFTVKNGPDLRERFDHLSGALGRLTLRRRMHWNNDQAYTEACAAIGSVGSFEFKRGAGSGLWHPHFHDAWMCDTKPDQAALSDEWRELTGDSHVVNVTPFHYVLAGAPATADTVARDFSEVFKYALKLSELSLADNWQANQQLHGARLIRSFGALFGVKIPEDLLDDPIETEDLPYVELFYRFIGGAYELEHFGGDVPVVSS